MKKEALITLVLVALAFGLYFMFRSSPETIQTSPSETIGEEQPETTESTEPTDKNIKTFEITAKNFEFDLKEIKVNVGDTVRVVFKNEDGMHDWVIDELGVRTRVTQMGDTETVEFVADQAGTFEYYCSIGNHRAMGMVGSLVVE